MSIQEFRVAALRDEPLEHALQQAVNKALSVIWENRFNFTPESKAGIGGRTEHCTSVDHMAQEAMVSILRSKQLLEEYGFLCEERGVETWAGSGPYFTIDPLDGTGPFKRGNFHAVSVLSSAVRDRHVESVCIGDLTTRDLISYGPSTPGVNFISGEFQCLLPDTSLHTGGLIESRLLLRRPVSWYSPVIQGLARGTGDHFVTDESLGVWMPRLWKQGVRMAVLCNGCKVTSWDISPLIGVSKRLNYVFLRAVEDGTRLELFDPDPPTGESLRANDELIIHKDDLHLVRHLLAA